MLKRRVNESWEETIVQRLNSKLKYYNDPLGQTHSLASSELFSLCFVWLDFENLGRTDGRRTNAQVQKSIDQYQPLLWVGRVDQHMRSLYYDPTIHTSVRTISLLIREPQRRIPKVC